MSKKTGDYKIPFDPKTGNQLPYASPEENEGYGYGTYVRNVEWRENVKWEDDLKLDTYGRGRSSAVFLFTSMETGSQYTAFMTDSLEIFQHSVKGKISGTFTCVKRGANYGVRLVKCN